jgi:hypothetical protein
MNKNFNGTLKLTIRSNFERIRTLWSALGMVERRSIISERVDAIPLLLAQLERRIAPE